MQEGDIKPLLLCPVCLRKMHYSIGFDIKTRYQSLLSVMNSEFSENSYFSTHKSIVSNLLDNCNYISLNLNNRGQLKSFLEQKDNHGKKKTVIVDKESKRNLTTTSERERLKVPEYNNMVVFGIDKKPTKGRMKVVKKEKDGN
jgi:hypothetical protein